MEVCIVDVVGDGVKEREWSDNIQTSVMTNGEQEKCRDRVIECKIGLFTTRVQLYVCETLATKGERSLSAVSHAVSPSFSSFQCAFFSINLGSHDIAGYSLKFSSAVPRLISVTIIGLGPSPSTSTSPYHASRHLHLHSALSLSVQMATFPKGIDEMASRDKDELLPLSGGNAHFVFCGHLAHPLADGAHKVLIKHGEGYASRFPDFALPTSRYVRALLTFKRTQQWPTKIMMIDLFDSRTSKHESKRCANPIQHLYPDLNSCHSAASAFGCV
jgi:hypothetical protein